MSLGAAVLTFREGIEAALILAIMLGYLRKVGRPQLRWSVWIGALSAISMAVLFTVGLQLIGTEFEDPGEAIYEGATSLLAVGMLTYMIFWMSKQARYMKGSLEHSMKQSLVQGAAWGLFALAFMTVAREGVETALFLSASAFESSGMATLVGGVVGIIAALVAAWAIYAAGVRLQMRTFFKITSVLLVVFAAAILRHAVNEFQDIGWLPPLVEHAWNTAQWVPESSSLGSVLQALIGYTPDPSLIQVIAYFGYLLTVGALVLRPARARAAIAPATPEPALANVPVESGSQTAQPVPTHSSGE